MEKNRNRIKKKFLNPSERLTRELLRRVNYYQLYKIIVPWDKSEFGKIDNMDEVFK